MDQHPDFKSILLTRHGANETICVSAYKTVNGKFVVSERFCNGVDEAANLIERSYQHEDIGAIWTNIQRLKPGSSRRKKGETIDAYTNMTIDIDRRDKRDADGSKVNATDGEREALRTVAEKIVKFLSPSFGPCVFADSGNGFHLNWKLADIEPGEGQRYYRAVLAVLKRKFESPEANVEIDASLADDTQVVTVWGTWNRKYPELLNRPQRQSKVLFFPPTQKPIKFYDLEIFLDANKHGIVPLTEEKPAPKKTAASQKADPEWLENHGVPDLIDFWSPHVAYEEDSYDSGGNTHHPIKPCPCHAGEDFHQHSHARDCEIIEFADGGVGISCFSAELSLGQVIAKMNAVKGENYPHRVFAEESDEEIARAFGVEDADAVPTPVGEVCYRENCACGNVHVQRPKPQELFEEDKSFDLVHTKTEGGNSSGLRVLRISDSPDRPVDWLWPNRLPAGSAFTASGPIGCNKSMALIEIAARISTGADWPDGSKNEHGPREVLICATEDELQTVIRPRLRAAKADLTKCLSLVNAFEVDADGNRKNRTMNLEKDTQRLFEALKEHTEILLVILDPVTGFYGNADPNDNRKIRQMITKIAKMCRITKTAVACIVHENKKSDVNAVDKMMGASSLSQVVRAGMRFSFDNEKKPNGRIMASLKNSYGGRGGGMKFVVEQTDMLSTSGKPLKDIGYVMWTETHGNTADEVRDQQRQKEGDGETADSKLETAIRIYETELAKGKRLQRDVHPILDAAGVSDETKRRARRKLGIRGSQGYPWYWWLPGKEQEQEGHSPEQKIPDSEVL
jgi:putative DNA primase/helicase